MGDLWTEAGQDLRYTLRQIRRAPGFSAVVIVTLAIGIGANAAVFSVLNGVLLRPLPYEDPEELVGVATAFPTMDFDRFWMSPPEYYELREWSQAFEEMGAWRVGAAAIETYDRPLEVTSAIATWSLFPTLGVRAAIGRTFTEDEDRIGAPRVALISNTLWRTAFGGDPAIVGQDVRVGGEPATIIGVLPPGFDVEDAGVDVWLPLNRSQNVDPADHVNRRGNHFMNVVARLADGVSFEAAEADLDRVEARSLEEYGASHAMNAELHPLFATDFRADVVGDAQPTILLLMGAVGLVLLIACANAASLLLAKSEGRSREVAVRVAMGARPGRLTRQLLTEGLTLAFLGAAVGLVLGQLTIEAVLRVNPDGVPRVQEIGLDPGVLAFTAGVALVTGILFGLAPLLGTTLAHVASTLREGGARSTRGAPAVRARRMLVVAEVALAVVLLTGSGLMLRSVAALQAVDLGFDTERLLTARITLPASGYPNGAAIGSFVASLLERAEALPGVTSASGTSGIPPVRVLNANDTSFEGIPVTPDGPAQNVDYYTAVLPGYLETMEIPILDGRGFEPSDELPDNRVALVNERLVRTFYPDQSPIGRRVQPSTGAPNAPWFTIVGVVGDVAQAGVTGEIGTELYFFHPQATNAGATNFRAVTLVLRTAGDPMDVAPALERVVAELDPALPVAEIRTMDQTVASSLGQPRFLTLLLGVFAAIALVLAAVGTYAVMSYSVIERTQEIGIRMAMGARSGSVRRMILRQGGVLAAVGLLIGVPGAIGLTRLLSSQLYGVGALDPVTFVVAPVFLGTVALLASYLPAVRASSMDPVVALRTD